MVQSQRGCSVNGHARPSQPAFVLTMPGGDRRSFYDCPVNLVPPRVTEHLREFVHYRSGRYWHGGPVGSWPWRHLRAMEILGDEVARIEADEAQREAAKRRTAAGRRAF